MSTFCFEIESCWFRRLVACEVELRVLQQRLVAGELALVLGEQRLVGPGIDLGEVVARLDGLALAELDLR